MAIKILITLEGTEQINSALDAMSKRGEDFMRTFQDLGKGQSPLGDVAVQLQTASQNAGKGIDLATQSTHGFVEALRVVIPSLRLAGVEVGNFSGFSRLATVGLGGLAAAITGAVIVALANLEENAARTRASLDSLFGSKTAGGAAFENLQQAAADLDTTIGALAPVLDSLTRAWQRFVQSTQGFKFVAISPENIPVGAVKDLVGITETFIKLVRTGGADEANATKQAKAFFDTLAEGGKITREALKPLDNRTVQLFAEAMGRGKISAEQFRAEVGLAPIDMNRFVDALARFRPQADQAFDAEAVKSFKDEFQGLLNDIQKASTQKFGVSIDQGLINFIRDLRKEVPATANDFKSIAGAIAPIVEALQELRKERETPIKAANVAAFELPKDIFKPVPEQAQTAADQSVNIFKRAFSANFAGQTAFAQSIWTFLDSLPSHVQVAILNLPAMFEEAFGNIKSVVKGAWDGITAIFSSDIVQKIIAALSGIGPAIAEIWKTIKADASAAWTSITTAVQATKDKIVSFFTTPIDLSGFFSGFQGVWDKIVQAAQAAYDKIKGIFSPAVNKTPPGAESGTIFGTESTNVLKGGQSHDQLAAQSQDQTQTLVAPFEEADNQIRTIWIALTDYIATAFDGIDLAPLTQKLVQPFTDALPTIRDALLQVEQMLQALMQEAMTVQQAIQNMTTIRPFGGGGELFGAASGGLVRGPGTGTSDSILAWLSNREYVLNAKATSFYGENFLHALNSMRIPRDMFAGFSMGGLVNAVAKSLPRFADGGPVAAGVPVTFVIDRQRFNLNATEDTVKALSRFAVSSQLSSAGRKPSWVR